MGERSDLFLETKFFLLSDSFSVKKLAKRGGHRFGRSGRHTDQVSRVKCLTIEHFDIFSGLRMGTYQE